jgi:hypothetical protein
LDGAGLAELRIQPFEQSYLFLKIWSLCSMAAFIELYAAQLVFVCLGLLLSRSKRLILALNRELGLVNACRCHLLMMHRELLLSTFTLHTLGQRLALIASIRHPVEVAETVVPVPAALSPIVTVSTPARSSSKVRTTPKHTARTAPVSPSQRGIARYFKRKHPSPMRVVVQTTVDPNSPVEAAETCDSGLDMGEPKKKRVFIDPSDDSEEELA